MFELESAINGWRDEVESEAAKLIGAGVPPWDAIVKAKGIVSRRRQSGDPRERFPRAPVPRTRLGR